MEEEDDGVLWAEDDDGEEDEEDVLQSVFSSTTTTNANTSIATSELALQGRGEEDCNKNYYDNKHNSVEDEVNSLFAHIDNNHNDGSSSVPLLVGSRHRQRQRRRRRQEQEQRDNTTKSSTASSSTKSSTSSRKRRLSRQRLRKQQLRQRKQQQQHFPTSPLEDLLQELTPTRTNHNDSDVTDSDDDIPNITSSQIPTNDDNDNDRDNHSTNHPQPQQQQKHITQNQDIELTKNQTDNANNIQNNNNNNHMMTNHNYYHRHKNTNTNTKINDNENGNTYDQNNLRGIVQKMDGKYGVGVQIIKDTPSVKNNNHINDNNQTNLEEDFDNGIQWGSIDFDAMEQQAKNCNNYQSLKVNTTCTNPAIEECAKNNNYGITSMSNTTKITTHPQPSIVPNNNDSSNKNDNNEYGDFPIMDFEEFDNLVASNSHNLHSQSLSSSSSLRPHTVTPTNNNNNNNNNTNNNSSSNNNNTNTTNPPFSYTPYVIHDLHQDTQTMVQILHVKTHHPNNNITDEKNNHKINIDKIGNDSIFVIELRDEWFYTPCQKGDVFHLISPSGQTPTYPPYHHPNTNIIGLDSKSSSDLWLILHPHLWLTPTLISETLGCSRRSTLSYRCPSHNTNNISALMGSMRHELFQCCLQHNNVSVHFCQQQIRRVILPSMATKLLCCRPSLFIEYPTPSALEHDLLQTVPQLQQFFHTYVHNANTISGTHTHSPHCHHFQGQNIHALEECTTSPEFGLKGNIDVTVLLPPNTTTTTHPQQTPNNHHTHYNNNSINGLSNKHRFMPIELKTGHVQTTQNAHMAQLSLYILLLQSRYNYHHNDKHNSDKDTTTDHNLGGMLLYLNHKSYCAHHVHPSKQELASLLGLRNSLANAIQQSKQKSKKLLLQYDQYKNHEEHIFSKRDIANIHSSIATPIDLPQMIPYSRKCDYCFSNRECMLYDAAASSYTSSLTTNNATDPTGGGPTTSKSKTTSFKMKLQHHFTGHLTKMDKKYFVFWDTWIDLEEQCKPTKQHWWLHQPQQTSSDYISSLTWDQSYIPSNNNNQKQYKSSTIIKLHRQGSSVPLFSSTQQSSYFYLDKESIWVLSTNDHLSLRNQPRRNRPPWMNLLRGSLVDYDATSIFIRTNPKDVYNLEKLVRLFGNNNNKNHHTANDKMLFRLDKFESMRSGTILRRNLIQLMTGDVPQYSNDKSKQNLKNDSTVDTYTIVESNRIRRLRKLIIQMEKPNFHYSLVSSMFRSSTPKYSGCHLPNLVKEYAKLNPDQKNAVAKVICAKDYALVQGLPGTGKTSTIAFLTRLLVARGKRVLITSYTHAAVDNLLLKLKQCGMSCHDKTLLRIGTKQSTHVGVHDILFPCNNDEEEELSAWTLHKDMSQTKVVGVTALTIPKTPFLVDQHFDIVIVDEAGQISQPAIIGALNAADQFILVGDHEQLPPLVKSFLPEQTGYGVSMLKRLATRHPDAVAKLTIQYRMHEDISNLCNIIIYKGELKTPEQIRKQRLVFKQHHPLEGSWWKQSKIFHQDHAVVFLNTDSTGFHETSRGRRSSGAEIVNMVESQITCSLVKTLLSCGVEATSLGIISPFRSQVNLLCDDPNLEKECGLGLEISTIDRYQGRDKEVIILSFVRSNNGGKCSRLLKDYRRLNVAFSRAKKKLIMVGSFQTLKIGSNILLPILDHLKGQGIVEDVPNYFTNSVY